MAPSPQTLQQLLAELRDELLASAAPTCDLREAMRLTACGSESAFYRLAARLGVRPYAPGKWRRDDLHNAIARASHNAQRRGKTA